MPFTRVGLCATDQKKCARYLASGANPKSVAKALRTTVAVVEKFTQEKLDAQVKKSKRIEAAAVKHAADTRTTAAALAGAAKTILSEAPSFE